MMKELGIPPEKTIHTHPIKRTQDIEAGLEYGVKTFVVDSMHEIAKLALYRDHMNVLLRLSFRSLHVSADLSYRFGAPPEQAMEYLQAARDAGITVRGLCFHTGSNAMLPIKMVEAVRVSRQIFDLAAEEDIHMWTLDIGGGFPVPSHGAVLSAKSYAEPVLELLNAHFPDTEILAEPGRFISAHSMTLLSSVMGRSTRSGINWVTLDTGVYSGYSGNTYDAQEPILIPIQSLREAAISGEPLQSILAGSRGEPTFPTIVAGPTCDAGDVVRDGILLPELDTGDVLISPTMGAYSYAHMTSFNHFPPPRIVQARW